MPKSKRFPGASISYPSGCGAWGAEESTQAKRRRIQRVDELGERLARRLDNQDAGSPGRGRRSSDRSAYQRFHKAVLDNRLSGIVKPHMSSKRFSYEIDSEAQAAAERLDGKLLLVTSLDELSAEQVVERYRSLTDIERGFRVLKSEFDIAPVYHRLPDRIRAHAMICFFALLLYRVLRIKLKAKGSPFSVERALEVLEAVQLHRMELDGDAVQGISITPDQRDLFKNMEVEPPKRQTA